MFSVIYYIEYLLSVDIREQMVSKVNLEEGGLD